MFTVVVTGSRTWNDPQSIIKAYERLSEKYGSDVRIINGTARGADQLCARTAQHYGFKVVDVPADWERYGRSAGYRRNTYMLEMLDSAGDGFVLAFWDGVSKGTKHTIDTARAMGLTVHICTPQGWEVGNG